MLKTANRIEVVEIKTSKMIAGRLTMLDFGAFDSYTACYSTSNTEENKPILAIPTAIDSKLLTIKKIQDGGSQPYAAIRRYTAYSQDILTQILSTPKMDTQIPKE